ncbi:MAG: endonuclease/exonuclease/phosphatase family protein [Patescibacteria group bacterium]
MKIIFLNTWGGRAYEPLMQFLCGQRSTTDFFCLQEVFDSPDHREVSWGGRADLLAGLRRALPEHEGYFSACLHDFDGDEYTDFPLAHGNAIFAKKDLPIASRGDLLITGGGWPGRGDMHAYPHKLQYVRFERAGLRYALVNLHGMAYPGSKRDTPERLAQSRNIVDFLAGEEGEKILGGDFNLLPDTESIRMIERAGMRNLIAAYCITTTRSPFSYGQYPESDRQYFADYAFVSPGIAVESFSVPQMEVSDHLPLVLEVAV